jgi:hypothetical protein
MKNGGSLAGETEFIHTLSSSGPVVLLTAVFSLRKSFILELRLLYVGVEAGSAEQVPAPFSTICLR